MPFDASFVKLSGHKDNGGAVEFIDVSRRRFAAERITVVAETVAGRINAQPFVGLKSVRSVKIAGRDECAAGFEDDRMTENVLY